MSSRFMQFFVFDRSSEIEETTTDYTVVEPSESGPALRCQICGEYVEMLHWLPPHRVDLRLWGGRPGEFVFGGPIDVLVSERFVKIYRSANLKGFEGFEPVEVVKVKGFSKSTVARLPQYFHVRARLSRARINDKASGVTREHDRVCSECGGAVF